MAKLLEQEFSVIKFLISPETPVNLTNVYDSLSSGFKKTKAARNAARNLLLLSRKLARRLLFFVLLEMRGAPGGATSNKARMTRLN